MRLFLLLKGLLIKLEVLSELEEGIDDNCTPDDVDADVDEILRFFVFFFFLLPLFSRRDSSKSVVAVGGRALRSFCLEIISGLFFAPWLVLLS